MLEDATSTRVDGSADAPVPAASPDDLVCHRCGYSLIGLASTRCPECGEAVSEMKWSQRDRRADRMSYVYTGLVFAAMVIAGGVMGSPFLVFLWRVLVGVMGGG